MFYTLTLMNTNKYNKKEDKTKHIYISHTHNYILIKRTPVYYFLFL